MSWISKSLAQPVFTLRNRHRDVGLGKVTADQAEVQVPALRPPTRALDPRRHDVRVAGPDDALGFQPVQEGGTVRPDGTAWRTRATTDGKAQSHRAGVAGQAGEHELAGAGGLPAAVGGNRGPVERLGDRLDLIGHLPRARHSAKTPSRARAQFWAHSLPSAAVHRWPPAQIRARHERSRPVVNAGQQCWKACWGQPLASSNLASSAI